MLLFVLFCGLAYTDLSCRKDVLDRLRDFWTNAVSLYERNSKFTLVVQRCQHYSFNAL